MEFIEVAAIELEKSLRSHDILDNPSYQRFPITLGGMLPYLMYPAVAISYR